MYVLLDSCTWIATRGLTSHVGCAARFFLRSAGATLVVPEVVQLEVEHRLVAQVRKQRDALINSHRRLLAVLQQDEVSVPLPTPQQLREGVRQRLNAPGVTTKHIPLSLEIAHSAVTRAVQHRAPRRVRDAIVWETCLTLLDSGDVCFVSQDERAFFKAGKLSEELQKESARRPGKLTVHSSLVGLLPVAAPRIDEDLVVDQFWDAGGEEEAESFVEQEGLALDRHSVDWELAGVFLTSRTDEVALEIGTSWQCVPRFGQPEPVGYVRAHFSCFWNLESEAMRALECTYLSIDTRDGSASMWPSEHVPDGNMRIRHSVRADARGRRMRNRPSAQALV